MTILEWCRKNAPDALKDLTDEELLVIMEPSAVELAAEQGITFDDVTDSIEYNVVNNYLDYMVLELVRNFGDKLTFKGGYMLTKLLPDVARQTTDIDFSIQSSELYQQLIITMEQIGQHFVNEGICASYKVKQEIQPYMSGGLDCYDSTGKKIVGIDVGWHDVTYGAVDTKIDVGTLRAFEVERMLADKVCAILSHKRFRRPKDIYDVYCITNCLPYDCKKIDSYIMRRTEGMGADWHNYPFNEDVRREYAKAYNSLTLNSIIKGVELERPSFDEVLQRFDNICSKLSKVCYLG